MDQIQQQENVIEEHRKIIRKFAAMVIRLMDALAYDGVSEDFVDLYEEAELLSSKYHQN